MLALVHPVRWSGLDTLVLVAIVVLLISSAFLAMAETSLTRMSPARAVALAEEGNRAAQRLRRLLERPERFLNLVLLLELVCQLVAATLAGVLADHLFGPIGVVLATVFEVVVVFVLGEAVPKNWAVAHPDRAALRSATWVSALAGFPPIRVFGAAMVGLTRLVSPGRGALAEPYLSERELLAMADMAAAEEAIETEERALIRSVFAFGDTVAREVMVPRTDMVAVAGRDRVADVLEVAMAAGYSRVPVYEHGIDDVVGIAYTKDLVRATQANRADEPVRNLVRPAHFVPETKPVADLMREMQAGKYHMAIVVDEYGGTAGLVTLEDLIEELVGEIIDEFDVEEPMVEPLADGGFRVNARMPIDEVNELLGADLPEGDWDTVGGLVYNLLGHIPTEGESVEAAGHRLVAEKVQGRRIGRVRIAPAVEREGLDGASTNERADDVTEQPTVRGHRAERDG